MFWIMILTDEKQTTDEIERGLTERGFRCLVAESEMGIAALGDQLPDLVLLNPNGPASYARFRELSRNIKREKELPVMIALGKEGLESFGFDPEIDDFVTRPLNLTELTLRATRLIRQRETPDTGQLITCGDLVIDSSRCEVRVGDSRVMLTFKEYQLLKFLAANRGRVFSREALLDNVWGHDYYGGDRTVDVHVRRLRSKIGDQSERFIETVRNIGYRFRDN